MYTRLTSGHPFINTAWPDGVTLVLEQDDLGSEGPTLESGGSQGTVWRIDRGS